MTNRPAPPPRPPLPNRWHTRDFPVLLEIARAIDAGEDVDGDAIAATLGLTEAEMRTAKYALIEGKYLREDQVKVVGGGGGMDAFAGWWPSWLVLTERGRRAVGLWPSENNADNLVELFRQAAELTDDPEEKSRLRAAAGAVMSVSRDIVADLGAAWLRSQTGL